MIDKKSSINRKKNEEFHVDEEGAVTRCACRNHSPKGFMLQCEDCAVWQHGICVGISHVRASPKHYFCEKCRPEHHPYSTTSLVPVNATPKKQPNSARSGTNSHRKRRASVAEPEEEFSDSSPTLKSANLSIKKRKSIDIDTTVLNDEDGLLSPKLLQQAGGNLTELGRRRTRNPKPTYYFDEVMAQAKAAASAALKTTSSGSRRTSKAPSPAPQPATPTVPEIDQIEQNLKSETAPQETPVAPEAPVKTETSELTETASKLQQALLEVQKQHLPSPEKLSKMKKKSFSANMSLREMQRRVQALWAYALSSETLIQREKECGRWYPISSQTEPPHCMSLALIATLCQSLSDFQAKYIFHVKSAQPSDK